MWIKDPKTEKKSVTLTIMIVGFSVALIKLILAGIAYKEFSFGEFSGADFATVFGAVGAVYTARKYTDKDKDK